jgi:hypothetical protein
MQEKYSTPKILDTASEAARIPSAHRQPETHTQPCSLASGGQPHTACPRCAFAGPHQPEPGAGPHYARLVCGACGAFLRWLSKPRPVVPAGEDSPLTDAERRRHMTTWSDVAHTWTPQAIHRWEGRS